MASHRSYFSKLAKSIDTLETNVAETQDGVPQLRGFACHAVSRPRIVRTLCGRPNDIAVSIRNH